MYQSKWAPPPAVEQEEGMSPNNHALALSPSAPSFSPAPVQPADASSVDSFAPTGAGQDDLFDDLIPVDDSMRVRSEDDLFSDDLTPVEQPVVEEPAAGPARARVDGPMGRGRGRGRGQGRGSGRATTTTDGTSRNVQESGEAATRPSATPESAPTGPRKETTFSVRGDRQATGGIRKPKLTEEELAEKMAKIQIKNASLTAAHARAEADAASFAEREEQSKLQASQRQREERKDRQQMMGERERNRMRKMKAMEGREWDAEKKEKDFERGGRFDKKGGFARDREDYTDGREYLYRENRGGQRGGRGEKGGAAQREQVPPKQEEFPALPPANKPTTTGGEKSWADQVESSNQT